MVGSTRISKSLTHSLDGLEPGISQYQCSEALAPGN